MAKKEKAESRRQKPGTSAVLHKQGASRSGPKSFESLRNTIEQQLSKSSKATPEQKTREKHTSYSKQVFIPASATTVAVQGKKRDRKGNIKPSEPAINGNDDVQASPNEGDFEKEVRALGGTHEDIELMADADSDSELEGTEAPRSYPVTNNQKGSLEKGISNILKEIALAHAVGQDVDDVSEESDGLPNTDQQQVSLGEPQRRSKTGLCCEIRPDWFAPIEALDMKNMASKQKSAISSQSLKTLQNFAEDLLKGENDMYKQKHQSGSSQSFYNTVITSGTLSDKISALTLAVQDSPIHNKKALETLLSLSKKRSRSQAVDVLRALKDLLAQGALLPSSRRLYSFASQPMLVEALQQTKSWSEGDKLPKGITEQYLIIWAFESWLKEQYFEMLKTLEVWCNDELEFAQSRAMSYVYELLKEKPEQESNLLRLLVNKLGDPVKKIASQACYLLMQLLTVHPAMKPIVVSAIGTDFIFRPGQSLHGKYYATVTLNQTALSASEEDVAQKLLSIYFGVFSTLLKTSEVPTPDLVKAPNSTSRGQRQQRKKPINSGQAQTDELREKLTSALLTGVNRAYPYADAAHKNFEEQLDTLFKIAHSANFNTSVQAMLLIQQLSASHQPSSDRFYRVLYESLLDPRLITASKQQLYLNLLHGALKADVNIRRIKAFVKRILQILALHEPSFICGAFFLLKDLDSSFPGLTTLTDQAEELGEDEEIFRDVDEGGMVIQTRGQAADRGSTALGRYDGHKRAPEHANADHSCAWEVIPFLAHFHPSVTVSADHYIHRRPLPGKPDLTLHTLIHFLDRVVYRNAKLSESKMRGTSIMQPMASDNAHAVLFNPTTAGSQRLPVNSEAFKAKNDEDVAAEDVFFHKYFSTLGKDTKKMKNEKQAATGATESDDEDAVWKAMLNTAPELEGAEDDDDDIGMSDLESAMDEKSSIAELDDGSEADGVDGVDVEAGIFDDTDEAMADSDRESVGDTAELDSSVNDSLDHVSDQEEPQPQPVQPSKRGQAKKEQRKTLRRLPTFASADDYAKMLEDNEDEDFGG